MELVDLQRAADIICRRLVIPHVVVTWKRRNNSLTYSLGRYYSAAGEIRINSCQHFRHLRKEILQHELAHHLAWVRDKDSLHGDVFKSALGFVRHVNAGLRKE